MRVIRIDRVVPEAASGEIFTGGPVERQRLVTKEMGNSFESSVISFSPGARSKFHRHSGDQLLIVTTGKGIVATEKQETAVSVGDIILIPAGEKHWHGATKDSSFAHIFVVVKDSQLIQLED